MGSAESSYPHASGGAVHGQALEPRILRGGGLPGSSDALKRQQKQHRDEVRRLCAETGVTAITAQRLLAEEKVALVCATATNKQPSKYQDHKSAEWIHAYFEI
jgi:hypothetical protein